MLNQPKDILEEKPPFLISLADGKWHLVIRIKKRDSHELVCICIKKTNSSYDTYEYLLREQPFHIAEGIWELSYGVEIMTLLDDSLNDHPALVLWKDWVSSKAN